MNWVTRQKSIRPIRIVYLGFMGGVNSRNSREGSILTAMARPRICFLRDPQTPDPYEELFNASGFEAFSSSVLSFRFINEEVLTDAVKNPDVYSGLVLTSPRAVEALASIMRWLPGEIPLWHIKPVFAVGARTAEELRNIGFQPEGEESGTGEELAYYIMKQALERPLLFLCGTKRRDELPRLLRKAKIPFEELYVYETNINQDITFPQDNIPDWVVFFSPSGVEVMKQIEGINWNRISKAAIGPTTANWMERMGFQVDVIAVKPDPDGLLHAIRESMKREAP